MANSKLKFFSKKGTPLNFEYIGATAGFPLTSTFTYYVNNSSPTPGVGLASFASIGSNIIYLNTNDNSNGSIVSWANTINDQIQKGAKIDLKFSFTPINTINARVVSTSISGSTVTLNLQKVLGPSFISDGSSCFIETIATNLPGGHFQGTIYFDPVSAGLYENEQIFIIQEFKDSVSSSNFVGLPHTLATGATGTAQWRTRWENNSYGNVDVTDLIFTYKIIENDPSIGGDPSIINFQNITIPVVLEPTDTYQNGFIVTPESSTPSESLQINVALNAPNEGANVYERTLVIEDISSGSPEKILVCTFYGQIIGEDSRLDVLTNNLGRSFFGSDSVLLRGHDPSEPLPNYVEINEKRKELMVAGEDIFPYIGSYKGLIGALKFFGYQDLRIKEYWLNLQYNKLKVSPLEENQNFLNLYTNTPLPNQTILIADVLDNENTGKYRLEQTYGPNENGEYVLNISSEETLIPSRTYKKTSLFGLYYDIVRPTKELDPYGYPITEEVFAFTQEEILVKLFGLKERLKQTYLPLNARIVDITGEGVYYNVYNTKSWTDILTRSDVNSGQNVDFVSNPDFGFLEDLRAFSVRNSPTSIQTPMNYNDVVDYTVSVVGGTGSAFSISGYGGFNPTIEIERGKTYNFILSNPTFSFYISTTPFPTQTDPLGVIGNGSTGGTVTINVNPQESGTLYYYSSNNQVLLNGQISVLNAPISDFGNIVNPLFNGQQYNNSQNESMLSAIENFYEIKQKGELKFLGDGTSDPISYLNPVTGVPYQNPLGMPTVLEYKGDEWVWDEMGMTWCDLDLTSDPNCNPSPLQSNLQAALTWNTINFSNINEIEWIIEKSATQEGSPYFFSIRGYIGDLYRLAHFLPYTGDYTVTCLLYDSYNFVSRSIKKNLIKVSPREITLDAWTRYRENEFYSWDQTIRDWDSYDSIWEYPAEGETLTELRKSIPQEMLDFAVYGNNGNYGEEMLVSSFINPVGASGNFTLSQNILQVTAVYSLLITGSQYGFANVITSQPHSFIDGQQVYISGSIPDLNKNWNIIIPSGSTGNSFQIPYILGSQSGVGITGGTGSIAGGTAFIVNNTFYPNQQVSGEGFIQVSVGGRVIGATASGSNLQSTVNSIIQEINSVVTQPDYFAQSTGPNLNPATVNIVADPDSGSIGNEKSLSVVVAGSLNLVSSDPFLSGGITGGTSYVSWTNNNPDFPNENLKYFGTRFLNWNLFENSTWDEAYAHSWEDFEYNQGWLGGFEIHTTKVGDNIKVSTGSETFPFPVGVTIGATGITGPSAYIDLGSVAQQLNNSTEPHISNFYYRVLPQNTTALLTTSGPINTSFAEFPAPTGPGAPPFTVPGGSPPLVISFTIATGP
jgi:hypothetical protein